MTTDWKGFAADAGATGGLSESALDAGATGDLHEAAADGSAVIIRPALESDIPRLEELLYQVHGVHAAGRPDLFIPGKKKYDRAELSAIIADRNGRPVFVAEDDGHVTGYCFCIRQVQTAASMVPIRTLYIDDLCVDEACRGRGIGKVLYDHTIAFARTEGYYNVILNVWACDPSAMRFYEKCGLSVQKVGMECVL